MHFKSTRNHDVTFVIFDEVHHESRSSSSDDEFIGGKEASCHDDGDPLGGSRSFIISRPVPGVKCPTCTKNGNEVWVIPGRNCGYCGTYCE